MVGSRRSYACAHRTLLVRFMNYGRYHSGKYLYDTIYHLFVRYARKSEMEEKDELVVGNNGLQISRINFQLRYLRKYVVFIKFTRK